MSKRTDPMELLYDEIDNIIHDVGADDPHLLFNLTQAWADNPLVMQHIQFRLGPEAAIFDAHMVGDQINGHAARAEVVANLLSGITDTSKEIAKVRMGWAQIGNEYLVHGILPGSVRLLIEAPSRPQKNSRRPGDEIPSNARQVLHQPSEESNALRKLAEILSHADPSLDEGQLDTLIRQVPPAARTPLKAVANTVSNGDFELNGEVREREVSTVALTFTPERALHLTTAIDRFPIPPKPVTKEGMLDGFRKSSRTVYLAPNTGSPVSVTVPDDEMLAVAASLATNPDQYVRVHYTEKILEGVSSKNRRDARVLDWIVPIEPPATPGEQLEVELDIDQSPNEE